MIRYYSFNYFIYSFLVESSGSQPKDVLISLPLVWNIGEFDLFRPQLIKQFKNSMVVKKCWQLIEIWKMTRKPN